MSAVEKSESCPLLARQSRHAVIDVSPAPSDAMSQFSSAEAPLSLMSCAVERFENVRRANGFAGFATPLSGDSASMTGALAPTLICTAVQQFSERSV